MKNKQLKELLIQSLEHERGGVEVYTTAVQCAMNDDLREEWSKYLGQTKHHVEVLIGVFQDLSLDIDEETPGRQIVHDLGAALVKAMNAALKAGDPVAAELVACECVVLAETKDHLNWELIGACAKKVGGVEASVLKAASEEVEDEEDEHLYHTKGWCRELWIESLGMRAVLPPPEERKHVKTAIGASRAEQARGTMR
ncbi:hypothetical protein [Stenotrophobium rhamnosiphilum]|uniref:DUF892 domain-containing protein n=1 Tax=Stenotrophobium rhamnosiphilum TaxID=2029166 RepID=A0A2T5MDB0_9GAMM|nr:hypothetical protein [Stenotrophobium rhamnosiphilum]PTU30561.1 hypothetical protein CJD38_13725 [Stenotrophobium rhamnosiphilum]